jgi:ankyrin repeat protein
MQAVQEGDAAIVQMLLSHGAEVNAQDDAGQTALMFAVQKGYTRIARILLDKGSSADLSNAAVATALTIARERGYGFLVNLLHHRIAKRDRGRQQVMNSTTGGPRCQPDDLVIALL